MSLDPLDRCVVISKREVRDYARAVYLAIIAAFILGFIFGILFRVLFS